jgi:CheY-like chemotaxis protein
MSDAANRTGTDQPIKTIMVVDADILARISIAEFLRDCGYRVIEAASGAEARAVLKADHAVEVLLIDMQLEDTEDGFALSKALRAEYPRLVILRTSSAAKLADKAAELCDDGPLEKPYHPQELLRRIQRLRARHRPDEVG